MIYDCFSFFNELELLEIRLNVLKDVVDKFVLVEATSTHTGHPKPLFYQENKGRFSAFEDKIIHVVVDDFPAPPEHYTEQQSSWMRENFQRNAIMRGLASEAADNDVIMISDVDEIPDPNIVSENRKWNGITVCEQLFMNFFVNFLDYVRPYWQGTRICRYSLLNGPVRFTRPHYAFIEPINIGMTPTRVRYSSHDYVLRNAGWHFSYLGGINTILKKIRSVGMEYEERYALDEAGVERLIENGEDITGNGGKFFVLPSDDNLPSYLCDNAECYSALFIRKPDEYFRRTKFTRRVCRFRGVIHRGIAKLLPRFIKPSLFKVYCRLVKNPINQ